MDIVDSLRFGVPNFRIEYDAAKRCIPSNKLASIASLESTLPSIELSDRHTRSVAGGRGRQLGMMRGLN